MSSAPDHREVIRMHTARGRWVIAAAVLGSGVAFLDGTVVNVALTAIADDFSASLSGLQWVLTGYLLTLGSFLVIGGSLGDLFGRRRVFLIGLMGFAGASLLCGIAPSTGALIGARCVQGFAAALLVPGSLAIISASFHPDDRGRAIGAWSGLAGISSAIGPFLGGWLIDSVSWRLVFLINLPIIAVTVLITLRHVPESRDVRADRRVDFAGCLLLAAGLGGLVYALIEGPADNWPTAAVALGAFGVLALTGFLAVEARSSHPMIPLSMFHSRQFSGANAVTFTVYAALGASLFLLVVHLQNDLGYSALEAGAALIPITVMMLAFSARAGELSQRIGPRLPMTVGPLIVGIGLVLLATIEPGTSYWSGVFPGIFVFASGLCLTVAPLTATVLAAADDRHAGVASAINNAVARLAGLLAIAVIPAAAGLSGAGGSLDLDSGFRTAMYIAAGLTFLGALIAWSTIRTVTRVRSVTRGSYANPCEDPCVKEAAAA